MKCCSRSDASAWTELPLSTTVAGAGPPLLLLHGFPDSAEVWRYQIPALASRRLHGHRSRPSRVRPLGCTHGQGPPTGWTTSSRCCWACFGRSMSPEPVGLIGHDWGAAVGWLLCMRHAERVSRFAALSVGHPAAYRSAGREAEAQGLVHPGVPVARRGGAHDQRRPLPLPAPGASPRAEDGDRWAADLMRPGRLTAALNWYRANVRLFLSRTFPDVEVPVLGVFSTGDVALTEDADDRIGRRMRRRVALCLHAGCRPLAADRAAEGHERPAPRLVRGSRLPSADGPPQLNATLHAPWPQFISRPPSMVKV